MLCAIFNPESSVYYTGKFSRTETKSRSWNIHLNKAKLYFKLDEARRVRASLNKKHPEWSLKIIVFELNVVKEI